MKKQLPIHMKACAVLIGGYIFLTVRQRVPSMASQAAKNCSGRCCKHVLAFILMKRSSAILIRDRRSRSRMSPPVGWRFLHRSKK
jgi:hypothetical protein